MAVVGDEVMVCEDKNVMMEKNNKPSILARRKRHHGSKFSLNISRNS